jgi:GNAT superfamily N-acetyltransferase
MTISIRPVQPGDEAIWRNLWLQYCTFYELTLPNRVTDTLWARLMDQTFPIHALVAEADGTVQGFTNYVIHPYTWGTNDICYLEDLFVSEDARGKGLGRALIEDVARLARLHGWTRVYWNTHENNTRARALYDKIVPVNPFVRYVITVDAPGT